MKLSKAHKEHKDLLKNLSFSDQLSKATRMKEGSPGLSVGGEFSRGFNRPKFNVLRFAFNSWDQNRGQGDIKFFDKPVGGKEITWDYGDEVNKRLKNSSFSYKGKRYNLTNLEDTDILKKAFPEVEETAEKMKERLGNSIEYVDQLEKDINKEKDKNPNLWNPDRYERGTPEYNDEAVRAKVHEHIVLMKIFTKDLFRDSIKRRNSKCGYLTRY